MKFSAQYKVAKSNYFIGLVQQALIKKALAVRKEDDTLPLHQGRMVLATKVLNDPSSMSYLMAPSVIAQEKLNALVTGVTTETATDGTVSQTLAGTFTDVDISTAVDDIWDSYCIF